jgi:hypothetical protein
LSREQSSDVYEVDLSQKLLHDSWVWAREVSPSQPITSCTAGSAGEMNLAIIGREQEADTNPGSHR